MADIMNGPLPENLDKYSAASRLLLDDIRRGYVSLSARELAAMKEHLADSLYSDSLPEDCYSTLSEALKVYEQYRDLKAQARMHNKLGMASFMSFDGGRGDPAKGELAVQHFSSQAKLSLDCGKVSSSAMGRSNAAVALLLLGKVEDAQKSADAALAAAEAASDEDPTKGFQGAFASFVRGVVSVAYGDFEYALAFFVKDLETASMAEGGPSKAQAFRALNNQGLCCVRLARHQDAATHFKAALDLCADLPISANAVAFEKAKTLYHLALCHFQTGEVDLCAKEVSASLSLCDESASKLLVAAEAAAAAAAAAEAAAAPETDEAKLARLRADGSGGAAPAALPTSFVAPPAFGTAEGGLLHAQVLTLDSARRLSLSRPSDGVPLPDVAGALAAGALALGLDVFGLSPLAQAGAEAAYGLACAVAGDAEGARKAHSKALKLSEDEAAYGGLAPGFRDVGVSLATVVPGVAVGKAVAAKEKKTIKSQAMHNRNLSDRNGVALGFENASGINGPAIAAPALRSLLDLHKRAIEVCDKNSDDTGSARGHAVQGGIIAMLGGKKADAFGHMEIQLKLSRAEGNRRLEAGTLRSIAELQESGAEFKSAIKTLRGYLKLSLDLNDPILLSDAYQKLASNYASLSKTKKEIDFPLPKEEFDYKTDEDLDKLEDADEQFLRANSASRAVRYLGALRTSRKMYWGWGNIRVDSEGNEVSLSIDADREEAEHMEGLVKTAPAAAKPAAGGLGGMFGGKSKPKAGLLSMFG